ncbi:hypothetical protein, conserved [Leishmania tarentolae]|uniref:Uncharacterized protein n=1 Tax=Leishmania tarentolae TaxID=5689 RepID=A0A640KQ99_LEITA|nr:hypothetical protein, conserved [Leishmania tarentolae]
MTDLAASAPAVVDDRYTFLVPYANNSTYDLENVGTQTQAKTDAVLTPITSAEDSHCLNTPESDSLEINTAAATPSSPTATVPRWSSLQKALEACMDPDLLSGSSNMKDHEIAEEVLPLMDSAMTVHVLALVNLSCLQPLFTDRPRSERIHTVLDAVRASNKLMLLDDLPAPSSNASIFSVDEAEVAGLRVSLCSRAQGNARNAQTLGCLQHTPECENSPRSPNFCRLREATPQHKTGESELLRSAPCAPRAALASPAPVDRAHTVQETNALHKDVSVSCLDDANVPSRALPITPVLPVAVAEEPADIGVPAPRRILQCPRVVGEEPLHSGSCGRAADDQEMKQIPTLRACVPVPKPPPTIDALVTATSAKLHEATVRSSLKKTTSVPTASAALPAPATPSATATSNTTKKSHFSVTAVPFLPKSVLSANSGLSPVAAPRCPANNLWSRHQPAVCEHPGACPMAVEALTKEIPTDSRTGCMDAALDLHAGTSWGKRHDATLAWRRGWMTTPPMPVDEFPSTLLRKEECMPAVRPLRALGADVPQAPCAIDVYSEMAVALPVGELRPPRPLIVPIPSERVPDSSFGGCGSMCSSPAATLLSPCPLSKPCRHRHDPYSPMGFVLCVENSCALSLSQTNNPTARLLTSSTSLKPSSSACNSSAAGETISFCFADPLIKATARLQERRRLPPADATRTPLSELESASCSVAHSSPAGESGDDVEEAPSRSLPSCEALLADALVKPTAAAAVALMHSVDEDTVSHADASAADAAPKSYAEALRLRATAFSPALVVTAKLAEKKNLSKARRSVRQRSAAASSSHSKSSAATDRMPSRASSSPTAQMATKMKRPSVTA